eukprot:2498339-Alexandrium_andersonii.AAC.1
MSGWPSFARHDVRTGFRVWLAVGAQSRMSSRIRVCFVAFVAVPCDRSLIGIATPTQGAPCCAQARSATLPRSSHGVLLG